MITARDCMDLSGLEDEVIQVICEHEHLPPVLAVEKGEFFLNQSWGPAAIDQMILDQYEVSHDLKLYKLHMEFARCHHCEDAGRRLE